MIIWFTINSFTVSIKALRTVLPFLSFKGLAYVYLVRTSMIYNKYLTFHFLEDNESILAESAAQTLPLNLA